MTKPKIAIVVTTIGGGEILEGYCKQADIEGVRNQLKIIVIPDKKTPATLYERCNSLFALGFDIACPSLSEQETYLNRFGNLADFIPYNSDNRRNIGFLMALDWSCDVLISLDDDNYCMQGKVVFDDYAVVCSDEIKLPAVHSSSRWFNACDLLELEPDYKVYLRGFPYTKRHQQVETKIIEESGIVRLNTGLWIGEPDLDAINRLATPVHSKSFKGQSVLLGQDTWCPINTQNTSLHRDLIITYYFVRMGYSIMGLSIDRYGDIFSGYFCQVCMRHLGHRIRIGTPISLHRRNSHNYLRDLTYELACICMLEEFTEWLQEVKLEGKTYKETYLSLSDALDEQVEKFRGFIWGTGEAKDYFRKVAHFMRRWVSCCEQIG